VKRLLATLILGACACGPSEPDRTDLRYVVMDLVDSTNYELTERRLPTLESVVEVRGLAMEMRHGGELYAGILDPQTKEDYKDALKVRGDKPPALDFTLDGNVVVPFDLDSLMMLTVYHHIESAQTYFDTIELADPVGPIKTYYRPTVDTGPFKLPFPVLSDNAAYAYTMDAFLMPPQFFLNELPLAANRGVMVHEYSHAVFNRVVFNNDRAPDFLVGNWPNIAVNEIRSLDEGIADIFGALQTGNSNFIAPSISEAFGIDRDLAVERVYTTSMLRSAQTSDEFSYDPYGLGSVVASALWSLLGDINAHDLGVAVLNAMAAIRNPGEDFRVTDFFNAIHPELSPDIQAKACAIFRARLAAVASDLECTR